MSNRRFPDDRTPATLASKVQNSFETLTLRTYRQLRKQIVTGHIPPGQRLVRRQLSAQLGVSPVPVTEALFKLEQDGLVETAPMYGSRVIRLTQERIRNDQVMREAIECQTVRLCTQYAEKSDLQHLQQLATPLDQAMLKADPHDRAGMQQHMDFHLAIAQVTGFTSLEEQLIRLWNCRLMQLSWANASLTTIPKRWHQRLVRAMAGGDADVAEAAMRKHIEFGTESLLRAHQKMMAMNHESES